MVLSSRHTLGRGMHSHTFDTPKFCDSAMKTKRETLAWTGASTGMHAFQTRQLSSTPTEGTVDAPIPRVHRSCSPPLVRAGG